MSQHSSSNKSKHMFFIFVILVVIVLSITAILSTAGKLSSNLATDINIISGLLSLVAAVAQVLYSTSHPSGSSDTAPGGGGSRNPPMQRGKRPAGRRKSVVTMVIAVALPIIVLEGIFFGILHPMSGKATQPQLHLMSHTCDFVPTAAAINAQGIGAQPDPAEPDEHACIGISDGALTAFDFSEQDRPRGYSGFKGQVMTLLAEGHYNDAVHLWKTSPKRATNDAEMGIYLLDQQITTNYITLVVTTIFPFKTGGSRDVLQGVYVLQQEAMTSCVIAGCVRLRVLIANAGQVASDAITVSQQIVQAARHDKTIIGVIGWPYSEYAVQAMNVLGQAQVPMISPNASDDSLSGQSQYFFRVAPRNALQTHVAALYAQQLEKQRIVVFYDPGDAYSKNLAQDFWQDRVIANSIADKEIYTGHDAGSIQEAWNRAKKYNPDLVYFAGYPEDVSSFPRDFPPCPDALSSSCLKVLGGDALYVLGNYTQTGHINYNRLRFTAFAFPDEWQNAGFANPPFFSDYAADFDPTMIHPGAYGWERPDAVVILAYDAVGVAMYGYRLSQDDHVNLQQGLTRITGDLACEGISGRIDFQNGDVPNKAVVMLAVNAQGYTQMAPIGDQFYQSQLSYSLRFCS